MSLKLNLIKKEFTTPFEEIFMQEVNKCLQKFYLSARKKAMTASVWSLGAKIVIIGYSK